MVLTEKIKAIPPGIDLVKTFSKKLPLTKFLFGCKAKAKEGIPITAILIHKSYLVQMDQVSK